MLDTPEQTQAPTVHEKIEKLKDIETRLIALAKFGGGYESDLKQIKKLGEEVDPALVNTAKEILTKKRPDLFMVGKPEPGQVISKEDISEFENWRKSVMRLAAINGVVDEKSADKLLVDINNLSQEEVEQTRKELDEFAATDSGQKKILGVFPHPNIFLKRTA